MNGVLVLMYHAVRMPEDVIPAKDFPYSVSAEMCDKQLTMLREAGYVFVDPAVCGMEAGAASRRVLLTFDDSWASHVQTTVPLLQRHGAKGVFFLTTNQLGQPGMMAESDVAALVAAGMTVGSHGVTHQYFDMLNEAQLREELAASQSILARLSGQDVTWLGLPGGRGHPALMALTDDMGYRYVATSRAGLWRGEQEVPRMAVMDATSEKAFLALLADPATAVVMRNVRQWGKGIVRRVLGNRMYDRLREALLPRK